METGILQGFVQVKDFFETWGGSVSNIGYMEWECANARLLRSGGALAAAYAESYKDTNQSLEKK